MWRNEFLARERIRERELTVRQHVLLARMLTQSPPRPDHGGRPAPHGRVARLTVPLAAVARAVAGIGRRFHAGAPAPMERRTG